MALGLLAAVSTPALADNEALTQPLTFSLEDNRILAEGAFVQDTAEQFEAFLAVNGKTGGQWNIPLYIQSPGGSLGAALQIGESLRAHGISTVAFNLCASACTYMMMGGVNRVVTRGTAYGVHQFSFDNGKPADEPVYSAKDLEAFQNQVAMLHDYAVGMGVDSGVVAIASHTPPGDITNLTRDQLVSLNVENVPTAEPEGQPLESVSIPGVTTPQLQAPNSPDLLQELQLDLPKLQGIAQGISTAVVRRVVLSEAGDLDLLEKSLANSYGLRVRVNGALKDGADVVAEKRRMVTQWGYRNRTIDESTVKAECAMHDLYCVVSGEYDNELGVSADGLISRTRWRFAYTVMLPLAAPAITIENISQVE